MPLYPLKFKPRYLEKIWGGRKIQTELGKSLPPGQIGESWELFDFPPGIVDQSGNWVSAQVVNGPLAGRTLHQLVQEFGTDLHGDVSLVGPHGQFPILIKFLDAREDLSVQVHPPKFYADTHPDAHLKSEAWYVLQHDPGSRILKGLMLGVKREDFASANAASGVDRLIRSVPVKDGDCFYLPSGTVHALGAGILVAEVQTPSDTTFRVYDFNRIDPGTGKPRQLHVEEALDCIDFTGQVDAESRQKRSHVAAMHTTVTQLVNCPYFKLEKVRMTQGVEEPVPYDEPVIWIMLEGKAEVKVEGVAETTHLTRSETVLLPAGMKNPIIKTSSDCVWLEVTFPLSGKVH